MIFFLTQKAKQDLINIARYTEAEWGREQRNSYLAQLDESFHRLADYPEQGMDCSRVRSGYRKYRVGRHFVFYRQVDEPVAIEIVRILHQRMDVDNQL